MFNQKTRFFRPKAAPRSPPDPPKAAQRPSRAPPGLGLGQEVNLGPPRITPIRLLTQTQPQEGLWETLGHTLEGLEEVLGQPLDGKNVFFDEKRDF